MFNLLLPFHPLCFLRYMLTSGFGTTRFGFSAFFRRKPLSHRHRRIIRIFIDVALHQTARLRQTLIKTLTAEFLIWTAPKRGRLGGIDSILLSPSRFFLRHLSFPHFPVKASEVSRFEFLIGFNLFIQHKFCFCFDCFHEWRASDGRQAATHSSNRNAWNWFRFSWNLRYRESSSDRSSSLNSNGCWNLVQWLTSRNQFLNFPTLTCGAGEVNRKSWRLNCLVGLLYGRLRWIHESNWQLLPLTIYDISWGLDMIFLEIGQFIMADSLNKNLIGIAVYYRRFLVSDSAEQQTFYHQFYGLRSSLRNFIAMFEAYKAIWGLFKFDELSPTTAADQKRKQTSHRQPTFPEFFSIQFHPFGWNASRRQTEIKISFNSRFYFQTRDKIKE